MLIQFIFMDGHVLAPRERARFHIIRHGALTPPQREWLDALDGHCVDALGLAERVMFDALEEALFHQCQTGAAELTEDSALRLAPGQALQRVVTLYLMAEGVGQP